MQRAKIALKADAAYIFNSVPNRVRFFYAENPYFSTALFL